MKNKSFAYYVSIVVYGIFIVVIMTGSGNLFGSEVDWIAQHVVFPDVFRQSFYESKQLIPNFLFQIGGGQNVFLFTYYGFLSPVILISYLLPFVDMTTYIMGASIVLYLLTGILVFVFLKHHFSEIKALGGALICLTLSPVNYHFHHHIMFVWYLPFLVMGLIGLDRYFETKKKILFIVSVFCLILTNYYFSVGSLVCLFVYAMYCILKNENSKIKEFLKNFWRAVYLFIIPVLLSAFVLFPTAYALFANSRSFAVSESIENLFLPHLEDYFFSNFGMGITGLMLVAVLANVTSKGLRKCEAFLQGCLLLVVLCPIVSYMLNGMLYVRGKVLIPFAVLFLYAFCLFIEKLEKQEIRFGMTAGFTTVFIVFSCIADKENYAIAVAILLEFVMLMILRKKPMLLYLCTIVILLLTSLDNNKSEEYVSITSYEELCNSQIQELMESTKAQWFRTNTAHIEKNTANKVYGSKFYGSSVYSSTSNRLYQDFYETYMGNNERYRNCFITSGAKNELFYTFMGTRYIIGETDPGLYYEKVAEGETLNLYENKKAYPIVYKSQRTMNEAAFDQAEFPYTAEYLMTHTVVEGGAPTDYQSVIEKCPVPEQYQFVQEEAKTYEIQLDESYRGKVLYLTFDIANEGKYQNEKDVSITINGVKNKLTAYTWQYYNGNTKFDYVIPLADTTTLTVEITKGLYDIQNLRMYTSPIIASEYGEADQLNLDTFAGEVSCSMDAKKGEYLVTSIPYDEGFTAYINHEPVAVEAVNKAFVGVKLEEGKNEVVIKYTAPFFRVGVAVSLLGVIFLLYEVVKTKHKE